jgi:hypothetical protein
MANIEYDLKRGASGSVMTFTLRNGLPVAIESGGTVHLTAKKSREGN